MPDSWKFYWGGTKYSNKRIYLEYMGNPADAPKPFQWIWKSCTLPRQKFFFWLLLQDRLNIRDLLNRKNFYIETSKCELCDDEPNEHLMHLFFSCDFSQNFWMNIGYQWDTDHNLMEMLLEGRKQDTYGCFKECLIAGCWSLWKHRNSIIFDHKVKNMAFCISMFKKHFIMIIKKAKPGLKEGMQSWLDTL